MTERKHRKHVPTGYMADAPAEASIAEEPTPDIFKSTCPHCGLEFEDLDGEAHGATFNEHVKEHSETQAPTES